MCVCVASFSYVDAYLVWYSRCQDESRCGIFSRALALRVLMCVVLEYALSHP